ncbi:MAG: cardiolipin synthase, partial [Bacillus sp. (in: firmicutes)]
MKTYLNETLRNSKEYDRKEIKMIKKILRVTSIVIAIFVFILIWMHIDVTLG